MERGPPNHVIHVNFHPSIAGEITFLVSKPHKGGSPVSLGSYGTSVDGNFVLDLFLTKRGQDNLFQIQCRSPLQ